jgi:hypothetical protein
MANNLKESLEGAGIGLLGGFVIGIIEADWIRMIIALALIGYAGKVLTGRNETSVRDSYRLAFTGVAAFLAIFAGLYINGLKLFKQTPKEIISSWVNAGYNPSQARELVLKQINLELQNNTAASQPEQTIVQKFTDPSGTGSLSHGSDSIMNRIDSLQSMVNKLMSGGSTIAEGKSMLNTVASNLFSSREQQDLCQKLDPDAFPDTAGYFTAIKNEGIDELNALVITDTAPGFPERYQLARLAWRLICTIENDTLIHWAEITDPKSQGYDPEKMHQVYDSQAKPVFGKLSEWSRTNSKNQVNFFIKINALIRRIAGN